MLQFSQVEIAAGGKVLYQIPSLTLSKGLIGLVGRNGSGKSTLLRAMSYANGGYSGSIKIQNKEVKETAVQQLAKKVAVVKSKAEIFGNHTVEEVILLGRLPYQNMFAKVTGKDREVLENIIERLQLNKMRKRHFSTLSDGEKQLVMIGKAFAQDTPLVLLDEPTAFLDPVNRFQLMKVLREMANNSDRLIIFSTHQLNTLPQFCDQVLFIANNSVNLLNEPSAFLDEIHNGLGIIE